MTRSDRSSRLADGLFFFLPPLLLFLWDLRSGWPVPLQADAQLYLNIADHFLSTGHFIQSIRPVTGLVVPPGLPLLLTLFRALGLGTGAIAGIQYLMAGGCCLLLSRIEQTLYARRGVAPAVFLLGMLRARMTPGNLFVEHYVLFFLCLLLRVLTRNDLPSGRKILWANLLGLAMTVFRPVMAVGYAPILVWTAGTALRERSRRGLALLLILPVAVFALNGAVNRRETGHFLLAENYAGFDLYLANNPKAPPVIYDHSRRADFLPDDWASVTEDPARDWTENNAASREAALRWAGDHPGTFAANTVLRFWRLWVIWWFGLPLAAAVCALLWARRKPDQRRLTVLCLGVSLVLALLTAAGLAVGRYTVPIWPLCSLHLSAGADLLLAGRRSVRRSDVSSP